MKKKLLTALVIILVLSGTITASADGLDHSELFDSEEVEFVQMVTTAYCCGSITYNGSAVHVGGAACNPRIGQVAIIYSMEGEYLMTVEVNDSGSAQGLVEGWAIDVYFPTLEECQEWMALTGGHVMIQFIDGVG